MHWCAPPGQRAWSAIKGEPNRLALRAQIESGECHAALLEQDGEPVGWCRAGPIESFSRLERSRKLSRNDRADWAIVCLYVPARYRRRNFTEPLIRAAVEMAFARGARSIEAYPVIPKNDTLSPVFAWTGVPGMFERAGFVRAPHDAGGRAIYRLDKAPPR